MGWNHLSIPKLQRLHLWLNSIHVSKTGRGAIFCTVLHYSITLRWPPLNIKIVLLGVLIPFIKPIVGSSYFIMKILLLEIYVYIEKSPGWVEIDIQPNGNFSIEINLAIRCPRVKKICYMSMMTSSNGTIFRVTGPLCGEFTGPGEFPTQRPVTRSFDVYFALRLNKRLSEQPWGWWFETLSWSLWRQCNAILICRFRGYAIYTNYWILLEYEVYNFVVLVDDDQRFLFRCLPRDVISDRADIYHDLQHCFYFVCLDIVGWRLISQSGV